ncbi:MAG TPA: MFS transporter [Spirochaetia bacterium]|nr:MFS transporter [Spirochaetia bacterium]
MEEKEVTVYGYRWVILVGFMLIAAMNQALWITFASITDDAMKFWATSDIMIGLLSIVFMAVYIVLVLPAAWLIDSWGIRGAVSVGALLTAVFGLTRGLFADNFAAVFVSQIGIAVGQPLVLGAITKLAGRWFPPDERATAAGLGTLAIYVGILLSVLVTPMLLNAYGMKAMLLQVGVVTALAAVIFLVTIREKPPTPAGPADQEARSLMLDGLKSMMRQKDFILLLVIFFVGLGMFNGVTTWIEQIVAPRGFNGDQAGVAGGLMLAGGIVGAFVIPLVSDSLRRRKPFIILALVGLLPGLIGLAFAQSYWLLLAASAVFGFFLLSAGPIGFQYGAELTLPAPEGTSNSMLLVMGQVSGILFIFGMDAMKPSSGSMTGSLLILAGLTVVSVVLALFLKESPIHRA